jgi:hypothetical protein
MVGRISENGTSLTRLVEDRVRRTTHNRVRGLAVEEVRGRLVLWGHVSTQHTRQLALQGALEVVSGDDFDSRITVG